MKKLSIILSIIVASFTLINTAKAQDTYYYFGGEKISLFTDSNSVVIYFKEDFSFKNNESTFTHPSIIEMSVSDETEDILMARLTTSTPINNILLFLSSMNILASDLAGYSYGYKTTMGSNFWPTMEIVFRLKQEIKIDFLKEILEQYNAIFVSEKYGVYNYCLPNINDVFIIANTIFENGYAQWAEPDFYSNGQLHSDPLYSEQYYLNNTGQVIDGITGIYDIDIDAPEAWSITKGSSNIKVAVIDDGVEDHEDLNDANGNSRVLDGYAPSGGGKGHPGKNGKHGQVCAGIIAASHNDIGIRGIAPNVKIIPIRIIKKHNLQFFSNKNIAKSIGKAWDEFGADILSCSWGWSPDKPSNNIVDAIHIAREQGRGGKGSVVVFASGNEGCWATYSSVSFPANTPGVLAVGAVSKVGILSEYSNGGTELDVVAPSSPYCNGGNIRTIDRMGIYGYNNETDGNYYSAFGGTSATCPQVAGIAALLLSVNPNLTEEEVYCRITISATDMGPAGKDDDFGYGLVNAYRAIALTNMNLENKVFGGVNKFTASNTITLGPSCIFENTGTWLSNTEVIAGNRIVAKPGSRVESGSYFHAYISNQGPCGFGPKMLMANNDNPNPNSTNPENQEKLINITEKENNNINQLDISVYPNPNKGQFTVLISNYNNENISLSITNILGTTIYNKGTCPLETNNEGIYSLKINISEQPAGIYFIQAIAENKIFKGKIIVQ